MGSIKGREFIDELSSMEFVEQNIIVSNLFVCLWLIIDALSN